MKVIKDKELFDIETKIKNIKDQMYAEELKDKIDWILYYNLRDELIELKKEEFDRLVTLGYLKKKEV